MIARVWAARATVENAPAYARHLADDVLQALREVAGYQGARLLQRVDGDEVEVVVVTWWSSREAIHGFAGADIETAVVTERASALLTTFDERVRHYDVVVSDDA